MTGSSNMETSRSTDSKMISKISVLIPVCQRVDPLRELYRGYKSALKDSGIPHEFLFVVDGGSYSHMDDLNALRAEGEDIRVLRLAKHFGEAIALSAGFEKTDGSHLLVLPAYHQISPDSLPDMLAAITDTDMVIARRWPRLGSWFGNFRRQCFHVLLRLLSGERYRDLGCNVRLFNRKIADEVHLYGDQHRFFPILVSKQGFRVKEIDVKQSPQDEFRGRYRIREYFHRVLDMVTVFFLVRFTKKPLRFFGMVGGIVSAIGGTVVFVTVVQRLFFDIGLADRPALLLGSLLLVLGVQTFALGLIGELIIFTHATQLKEYTIAEDINGPAAEDKVTEVGAASGTDGR
ncbi:MAG: glycosyltransferase [Pseudomonadota bacterium]